MDVINKAFYCLLMMYSHLAIWCLSIMGYFHVQVSTSPEMGAEFLIPVTGRLSHKYKYYEPNSSSLKEKIHSSTRSYQQTPVAIQSTIAIGSMSFETPWIRFSQFGSAPSFPLLLIPSSFCYFFLIFSFPSILFLNSFIFFPSSSFILENLTYKAQNQMCLPIQEEMNIEDEVQRLNSSKGDILQQYDISVKV